MRVNPKLKEFLSSQSSVKHCACPRSQVHVGRMFKKEQVSEISLESSLDVTGNRFSHIAFTNNN